MRSVLLLAGVLIALYAAPDWQRPLLLCSCAALPVLVLRQRWRPLALVALGCLYAQLVASRIEAPWLAGGERHLVEVEIDSVPSRSESGWQLDGRAIFPRHREWPARRLRIRLSARSSVPAPGERWQYAARIDLPAGPAARRSLLRDHLAATARVIDSPLNRRLAPPGPGLDALRARLARDIADAVADPSAAALLAALAVGVTGDVSTRQWQTFNATGITHLVAISGMHVTFFAMLSMAAARRIWRVLPALGLAPRRDAFAAATGIVLALLYALLSGFSVPAQRTVAMLAAFLLARESARRITPAWSVAVALSVVLAYDPMAALSAGFWLSFLAVAAIVLVAGARLKAAAPLAGAIRLQWLVTVALLPVTLAIFGSFSAIGMVANAVAIPVFTFLLVPPVLLATACHLLPGALATWCADFLVSLAGHAAAMLWPLLAALAGLPGALWWAVPPLCWFLVAPAAVALVVFPVAGRLRVLGLAMLAWVFLLHERRPGEGRLWMDVLDVGASTAVILRTRRHLVAWGTGETFGSRGRRFERLVLPQLRAAGHAAIDLWLPGPLTRDAQSALQVARANRKLLQVLLPPGSAVPPEMAGCDARRWSWDGVGFEIRPAADARSCHLLVRIGGRAMVLGADGVAPQHGEVITASLLPRAATSVARLPLSAGQLLIASVSQDEWNAAAWRRQRERAAGAGAVLLATAGAGDLRLQFDAHGVRYR